MEAFEVAEPSVEELPAPLPPLLAGANWAALFWDSLYSLYFGLWRWFFAFVVLRIAGQFLFLYLNRMPGLPPWAWAACGVAAAMVQLALRWMFALRANALLWTRGKSASLFKPNVQLALVVSGALFELVGSVYPLIDFASRHPEKSPWLWLSSVVTAIVIGALWLRHRPWWAIRSSG